MDTSYLSWFASLQGEWCNDSALEAQLDAALQNGATGATTNPPLSYEALTTDADLYRDALAALDKTLPDDEYAFEAMGLVVRRVAGKLLPIHKAHGGWYGCARAQVAPNLRFDAQAMLASGKCIARWGENAMVKIPGTKAGIWALEELAALGIPTNPTVMVSVSQMIAAAEAHERGCARASAAGITPAPCTSALVMGRLQDYLASLNKRRGSPLLTEELELAAVAVIQRAHELFRQKGYRTTIMGAAFRSAAQVERIAGAPFCSTIHPSIQAKVERAEREGQILRRSRIGEPIDPAALERVSKHLPEFVQAYEPEGLTPEQFDSYGAVVMTLDSFEQSGWKKLVGLKYGS